MFASKSKSGQSDTSNGKITPSTPRINKLGRAGSNKLDSPLPSPQQKPRFSIDRSPKSVDSKPTPERRSPKTLTPPDRQSRGSKEAELQEELTKAREQLALVEQEKTSALEELRDAKISADEANEKLKEALIAQKWAEESSDIEKSRADELEQASFDVAQNREEEWRNEIENVRNQHAVDLSALLSTSHELQRVRHELTMVSDAKNSALRHADDAMKIAEINAEKVEFLSREVSRLKSLIDSNTESAESAESEVDVLKHDHEREKEAENKLAEMETLVQILRTEASDAKTAEMNASELIDELKRKAELFQIQGMEAEQSKKEIVEKLSSEINDLKCELEIAKTVKEKWLEMETFVEGLRIKVADAKKAEVDACYLLEEKKRKSELLEAQLEEARLFENETAAVAKTLGLEVVALKHELERAKAAKKKLVEMEALLEGLRTEVVDAKKAEMDVCELLTEWKTKAEWIGIQLEESIQSEKSVLESSALVAKQLEKSNALLQDAESEIAALKWDMEHSETEVARYKADLNDSDCHLNVAKQEVFELSNTIEALKFELQKSEEERLQALNNDEVATSTIESLSEVRDKLINELGITREEGEKAKKAMEGFATAMHELSTEARDTQEKFLTKQAEYEDAHAQIKELQLALTNTEENYEVMLHEAKFQLVCLKNSIEEYKIEAKKLRDEWDVKEVNFLSEIKKMYEELAAMKFEMGKVVVSLRGVEHEAQTAKDAEGQMLIKLRDAESGAAAANEAADEAKAATLRLKETLLDKENELQNITQENDELRIRETAVLKELEELSLLLADLTAQKSEEKIELTNSEKEYNRSPSFSEFQEHTDEGIENPTPEANSGMLEACLRGDTKENGNGEDHEAESTDDDSKISSSSFDQVNGLPSGKYENGVMSPTKSQQQKKKKALLQKFGSLLKKKNNHK